jgi:hypothetical protein
MPGPGPSQAEHLSKADLFMLKLHYMCKKKFCGHNNFEIKTNLRLSGFHDKIKLHIAICLSQRKLPGIFKISGHELYAEE